MRAVSRYEDAGIVSDSVLTPSTDSGVTEGHSTDKGKIL